MRYIQNNQILSLDDIRRAQPNMSIPDGADLSDLGYYQIEPTDPPTPGPGQTVVQGQPEEYASHKWRETWLVQDIPISDLKAQKKAELADVRFRHETGGITVAGAQVRTDRDSQAMITGALAFVQINPGPGSWIDWKGADGAWVQLDAAAVTSIAKAVAAHVQACFSAERSLAELIAAAETVEEVAGINLETGWPA